jgi:RNA polymerase sigma factor (sigma-70 family)
MALVERCRNGDLGAFEELYQIHAGKLFSVACRILGNPSDAEDALQEIFLSAHRKLDGFRGESALGTWLYRLATNHCLDYLRSRGARMNQVTDALDDEPGALIVQRGASTVLLQVSEELTAQGIAQSLKTGENAADDISAALSTLTRAAALLEPVGRTALLLDTPAALAAVDRWADEALARGGPDREAPGLVRDLVDALLGVPL